MGEKGYSPLSMARNEGLSVNVAPFPAPVPRNALPRGLKYELVARSPGGVIVIDEDGNGEMFFSHPPPYIFNQQPPVCEVRHAVINEPSIYRKRRGKPSREERERRRLQKAKDRAAAAAETKAADQLQKEKAARVAEQNAAHRQVQISRSKAQKESLAAKKAAREKTYSEVVQTSPPPEPFAVSPKAAGKPENKVAARTISSVTAPPTSSPAAPPAGKPLIDEMPAVKAALEVKPECYVQTNVKLESKKLL